MAAAAMLRDALKGSDLDELIVAGLQLKELTPAERQEIVCDSDIVGEAGDGTTWGASFHSAVTRFSDKVVVWDALATVSDLRPPPLRDMLAHFSDASLLRELVRSLGSSEEIAVRAAAIRCCKNLGRVPKLRAMLEEAITPLAQALSEQGELAPLAAAALCNLACTSAGKDAAVKAGAVPVLLASITRQSNPLAVDDMVACLGVLTGGFGPGAQEVVRSGTGAAPLLAALRMKHPVLMATTLEVLGDLALCLGPSCSFVIELAGDAQLAGENLPVMVAAPVPQVRTPALKLVALLWELPGFQQRFGSNGLKALQAAADMEPPAPAAPPPPPEGARRQRRGAGGAAPGKLLLCTPGCDDPCCFDGVPGLSQRRPPTRREIAEQLLRQTH